MSKTTNLLFMLLCVSALALTSCKKEGCTDVEATNYDSDADKDDGSCVYPSDDTGTPDITTPFTAEVDGEEFVETTLEGTYESTFGQSTIRIKAEMDDQRIEIKVPGNIAKGTHDFDAPFTGSIGGYYHDGYSIYGAAQGTGKLQIVSKTLPSAGEPGTISGIFSFTASPYEVSDGNDSYEITNGQFKVEFE